MFRADQVDDLDARFQQFIAAFLILVGWRLAVNGHVFLSIYRSLLIDGIAQHVHDPTQRLFPDRNGDGCLGVHHFETP
jgi:hypothetical protein